MDEYQLFTDKGETEEIIKYDPIQISQNEIKYYLNIENQENMITFSLIDKYEFPCVNYIRNMSLKEIKDLNIIFQVLNSFNDFYDYLKLLSNNKKLNIKKYNDKITINFFVEVLLKQQYIEIDLFPSKKNIEPNIKEIWEELLNIKNIMKENNKEIELLKREDTNKTVEIITLKYENKELKEKIEKQNEEIKNLNSKFNNLMNEFMKMKEKGDKIGIKNEIIKNEQNIEEKSYNKEKEKENLTHLNLNLNARPFVPKYNSKNKKSEDKLINDNNDIEELDLMKKKEYEKLINKKDFQLNKEIKELKEEKYPNGKIESTKELKEEENIILFVDRLKEEPKEEHKDEPKEERKGKKKRKGKRKAYDKLVDNIASGMKDKKPDDKKVDEIKEEKVEDKKLEEEMTFDKEKSKEKILIKDEELKPIEEIEKAQEKLKEKEKEIKEVEKQNPFEEVTGITKVELIKQVEEAKLEEQKPSEKPKEEKKGKKKKKVNIKHMISWSIILHLVYGVKKHNIKKQKK